MDATGVAINVPTNEIKACNTIYYAKIFSNDTIGSNNGATYNVDFITGYNVPNQGAINLILP